MHPIRPYENTALGENDIGPKEGGDSKIIKIHHENRIQLKFTKEKKIVN